MKIVLEMEDIFKKVLGHLHVEHINKILDKFEFPKSQKKDNVTPPSENHPSCVP